MLKIPPLSFRRRSRQWAGAKLADVMTRTIKAACFEFYQMGMPGWTWSPNARGDHLLESQPQVGRTGGLPFFR